MKGMNKPGKESKKPSKKEKVGSKGGKGKLIKVPSSPKRNQVYPQQP
jgi:hypothetical protein